MKSNFKKIYTKADEFISFEIKLLKIQMTAQNNNKNQKYNQ